MTNKQSILFISTISPPITGVTTASNVILSHLQNRGYSLYVINYARGSLISGKFSLKQFFNILIKGFRILQTKKKVAHVYLAISSTFWGNMRDIFFLLLLGKEKRKSTVLHLHTATFDSYFSGSPWWVRYLIKKMFKDIKTVIVVGETFTNIFGSLIPPKRGKVVKNCVKTELIIPEPLLARKNSCIEKINILYLAHFIPSKGYNLLLDAYLSLPKEIREKTILNFAGKFADSRLKTDFLNRIVNEKDIFYHGQVQGNEKRKLLWDSHIFCFPTNYPPEAQPISILEAYAAGCIVLTTDSRGIKDIFQHGVNGYWITVRNRIVLRNYLELLISDIDKHKNFAFHNHQEAMEKYTENRFNREIEEILLSRNL
jgi:glycosyltransferase involved in cell wall biosynthesis